MSGWHIATSVILETMYQLLRIRDSHFFEEGTSCNAIDLMSWYWKSRNAWSVAFVTLLRGAVRGLCAETASSPVGFCLDIRETDICKTGLLERLMKVHGKPLMQRLSTIYHCQFPRS